LCERFTSCFAALPLPTQDGAPLLSLTWAPNLRTR
jgi:hypothetical protein